MSVNSSPEPMELETGPPPSLLTDDVTSDWPIEEDPDMILTQYSYSHSDFSEQMQADRDETRTKILSLSSEDQLTIGENIRAHPSHSEEILFSQSTSIKPKNSTSLPTTSPYLLSSPRHPFSSVPIQHTRDTPSHTEATDKARINLAHKNILFLNSICDHSNSGSEQNSEISPTQSKTEFPSLTPNQDLKSVLNNRVGEPYTDSTREENLETQSETPADIRRSPSPVITNGAEHEDITQLKSSLKPHTLDTPPLSSNTPEDLVIDPFCSLSPDTQPNGSSNRPQEGEVNEGAVSLKLSRAEDEIENKNPNYELETPPDDITDVSLATSREDDLTQQSSPSEFHDCEQGILNDEVPPPQFQGPGSPALQQDIDYSVELLTPTLLAEIETFSTVIPEHQGEYEATREHTPPHAPHLPSHLRDSIYSPPLEVTTRSHLEKCEDIICMQQSLQEKSRHLKQIIAQIEERILVQQSRAFISVTQDKSERYRVPAHTHSHLLMQTHTRESEKQARSFKATLRNCRDRMNTGFETESSSEDECYLNSTNLGGPKRRRLTKLHRSWLGDRAEIGGRWNWLDLHIGQIESELSSVNQRLEELRCSHLPQEEYLSLDTSSRCAPYSRSPSSSRVIHQSVSLRLSSLSNILQSAPHYHSVLSLPDDIPSTLLMYDSTMRLSIKDFPLDPKDLRKLELAISHSRTLPALQGSRYRAVVGNNRKTGHRPKLNNSQDQNNKQRYCSSSIAELSQHKLGKSKPFLSGSRQRRARSYDTTSIIIPGSYLPKPEKHSLKEIVIPGWRRVGESQLFDTEAMDTEDTTDSSFEAMHAKCEELEIRNYQDTVHCNLASSKKLKRLQISSDTPRLSTASYGWSARRFPLSSDECLEEFASHLDISKPTDLSSPIEDSVFSAPHVTSLSFKSQQ